MKTSNKLLIGTGICIVLGIFSFAFMMRGAYQKALANPLANELRIGLKAMKYLNLTYDSYITFKHGDKYEIVLNKADKDSLRIDYQGDMLNLKVGDINNITIYCPQLPIMTFTKKGTSRNEDFGTVDIDSSFSSGEFISTSTKNTTIGFQNCCFDKVDIRSTNVGAITINKGEIKLLNLTLPNNSRLWVEYARILSKNIIMGDSSKVEITGSQSSFLK